MGGWSGGVYSRFRNWVTDKANSINPQAALFDQEDDGFAAGLNNCLTKDGLNKPSSAMDWNGQNLTGVLNFAQTGTLSLVNGKWTSNTAGNLTGAAPTSGITLILNGVAGGTALNLIPGAAADLAFVISAAAGRQALMRFDANAAVAAYAGAAGAAGQGINDATTGDLIFRVQSGGVRFSVNGGVSTHLFLPSTGLAKNADDAGTLFDTGWRDLPQRTVSTSTTTVASDRGKSIRTSTAINLTLAAAGTYPVGTIIVVFNSDVANTNLIAGSGDTLVLTGTATTGNRTVGPNGLATCYYGVAGFWYVSGPGVG